MKDKTSVLHSPDKAISVSRRHALVVVSNRVYLPSELAEQHGY